MSLSLTADVSLFSNATSALLRTQFFLGYCVLMTSRGSVFFFPVGGLRQGLEKDPLAAMPRAVLDLNSGCSSAELFLHKASMVVGGLHLQQYSHFDCRHC